MTMATAAPRAITFPFQAPATDGSLVDVVPGRIKWLRMPLPMALNHINLYLVRDGAGWRMIDTGIDTKVIRGLWDKILPSLDGPITGLICTHHHSDHCGLAGWITDRLRVPLTMTRGEYFAMRMFGEQFSFDSWEYVDYFHKAGFDPARLKAVVDTLRYMDEEASLARAYQRMRHGDDVTIDGRAWRVHTGEGHSPEHASLHCAELGVLISGDQLLARISPNVGVLPFEPNANPLQDWFASLERIGTLPDDTLVLPAHELPFYGLGRRAEELRQHHIAMLEKVVALCREKPDTIFGLSNRLFPGRSGPIDDLLASSESLAHLAYLLAEGRVQRQLTADGAYLFSVQ